MPGKGASLGGPTGTVPPRATGRLVPVASALGLACLAAAWFVPAVEGRVLFIFTTTQHLADVVLGLAADGDVVLALVVLVFALVLPAAKLLLLVWAHRRLARGLAPPPALLRLLDAVGKWSMLDVLVAALAITTMKAQGVPFTGTTGPAILLLALTCGLTAAAGWGLRRDATRMRRARGRIAPSFSR